MEITSSPEEGGRDTVALGGHLGGDSYDVEKRSLDDRNRDGSECLAAQDTHHTPLTVLVSHHGELSPAPEVKLSIVQQTAPVDVDVDVDSIKKSDLSRSSSSHEQCR